RVTNAHNRIFSGCCCLSYLVSMILCNVAEIGGPDDVVTCSSRNIRFKSNVYTLHILEPNNEFSVQNVNMGIETAKKTAAIQRLLMPVVCTNSIEIYRYEEPRESKDFRLLF